MAEPTPVTVSAVREALHEVPDPEMPINIVDLGLVEGVEVEPDAEAGPGGAAVRIVLLPTFVGCPALDMIAADVRDRVGRLPGVARVEVRWVHEPAWSVDRITPAGRASLREHGVTVPPAAGAAPPAGAVELRSSAVACPFCGSRETRLDSPFGPTRCRMIYYCDACRNAFEHMKRIGPEGTKAPRHEG